MRVKISVCSRYPYRDPPIPRSRHITPMISLCREMSIVTVDEHTLPNYVADLITRLGYIDISDAEKAKDLFGIELSEDQYLKITLLGR
ncbi:MAG: hypothetical protein N3D82_04620 [Ignisphaera sp.]|nr:hypothetical protein [Ignisphaera sp.]MCX8168293.1 hypothetical protein [Ignisphaera sp.]MDW8085887.1 hypothetical protein [Ignisphaera sp.]